MDPMYLNLGTLSQPPNMSIGASSTAPANLTHLNGLPQESKLATYISNRQQQHQQPTHGTIVPLSPASSVTKTLAALSLDIANRTVSSGGMSNDFLNSSTPIVAAAASAGLAHSSSTPSFHSFTSSANILNNSPFSPSLNTNNLTSSNSTNNASNNPLAPHNFPALTNSSFIGGGVVGGNSSINSPATTLQYSAALNHRTSPSLTASPRLTTSSPPHQGSPDRIPRPTSPLEPPGVSTFQEHIGGTTYFFTAQELAALAVNSGGSNGGNADSQLNHHTGSMGNGGGAGGGTGGLESRHAASTATLLALPSYSIAPPTPAHLHHLRTPTNAPHFFVQDELRRQLLEKQTLAMAQLPQDQFPELPREVDYYHELVPQDNSHGSIKSCMFGYATSVYKATHSKTGVQYCLYRVHGFRLSNVKVMHIVDMWKKLQQSCIVQLREVFTTKVFGDNCSSGGYYTTLLGERIFRRRSDGEDCFPRTEFGCTIIFVYDYHPGAETLCSRFSCNAPLQPGWEAAAMPPPSLTYTADTAAQQAALAGAAGAGREMVSEAVLWNFIIQLTGAVRVIHNGGLACRMLDPSKVLLTDNCNRLRINCCGMLDVLNFDANAASPLAGVPHSQQEDLAQLGKLILSVSLRACTAGGGLPRDKWQPALDLVQRHYSRDLSMLVMCLMTQNRIKNINDVMPMIGARFYTAVECAIQRSDLCESELGKELHNGRLFRLITKLSTIVDRPHVNNDSNWCETGDRYMLKLFRDYLFYQTHEDGRPWLDLGHIVSVLNKLDSGSRDQLVLMSHDGQNVLVTTYSELKTCFLRSFTELMQAGTVTPTHKLS